MTARSRILRSAAFLGCSVPWSAVAYGKDRRHLQPQLPLGVAEFQSFVDGFAAEVDGSKVARTQAAQSGLPAPLCLIPFSSPVSVWLP